jgi:hypothetical protein
MYFQGIPYLCAKGDFYMVAYKLKTKVSAQGLVSLSSLPDLYNKEVELFVVPIRHRTVHAKLSAHKAMSFIDKWTGKAEAHTSSDEYDSRYEYLMEKYK